MKTKTFRKVMGAVLAFALVVTGLKFGEIKAVAVTGEGAEATPVDYSIQTAENDSVFVTKSAIALGDDNVKIEFEVKDKSVTEDGQSKGDVVLVIDASGNQNKDDMYVNEKEDAKKIALELTKKGYKVGVVSFRSDAKKELLPTNTYSVIEAAIDKIDCIANSPYHTNIQAGLHAADEMLGNQNRSNASIILLSDGLTNQCYRPYSTQENKVTLYNVLQSGSGVTVANNVTLASGFKYIKPIANASDGKLGSSYTQPGYIDSLERKYVFTDNFALVDEYYYLNKEYQNGFNNTLSTYPTIKCRKVQLNAGEKKPKEQKKGNNFTLVGDEIELTRWVYPAGLPNRGFYVNVMDTGFMTVSEAYLIKNKGTTIFTLTYPGFYNGNNKQIDNIERKYLNNDNDEKIRFRRFVMVNVANSPEKGVGEFNWFINTNKNDALPTALNSIINKLEANNVKHVSEVTITDTLPSYLSYDEADAQNVVSKTVAFDDNGVAKFEFTAKLDKPAMIAAYRANTSIGKVSADESKIWIDMNKAASAAYGTETINVPNPKLPFGIWNVNVEYQVEVPDSTGFNTEYKVVTAPAVQLFETETYTIKNVEGYDVTNPAKFKEPFVITTYSKGVDVVSPSDNKVKNSIGSEVNFDGESRNVYVFVGYELQSYTVSFYNENGEGIIERLIPVTEPVIPVADAPVDPQPAEGQPEEGQQDENQPAESDQQEEGQRFIVITEGEITRAPELASEPAIMPIDPAPVAPVEGTNGEEDEEEGFPEIPSSFTSVYEVYTVQVKYGVRISDGSIAEVNALANVRAEKLNDERHTNVQFAGWTHADKTSAGAALIAPITGDLSVYANYASEDVFYVTYKQYTDKPFNGVSNYGTPVPVVSGGSHTVLTTGPALSGYEFKGWSLSDAEDAAVLDVTVIENITADVVLYPVYEKLPDPEPVNPDPVDPTPVDPTPVDPTPVDPTPVDPTPVDPTPSDPTPSNPTPSNPNPSNPNPNPSNPDPAKEPEIDMGTEGTPLGNTKAKEPQVITYEGEPESELPGMEILDDGQALGDAVLPKTGTMPVPVFYVTGGLLAALAGILFFVKKRH